MRVSLSPFVGSEHVTFPARDLPVTDMGWEIDAPGLTETLRRVHEEYTDLPLYVTENGAAYPDEVGADGQVGVPVAAEVAGDIGPAAEDDGRADQRVAACLDK